MNQSSTSQRDQTSESSDVQHPGHKFGWVIAGVWTGVFIGDVIANVIIRPGYLTRASSAPTLAVCWLSGAIVGFFAAWAFDNHIATRSPQSGVWNMLFWLSLAYYWMFRNEIPQ